MNNTCTSSRKRTATTTTSSGCGPTHHASPTKSRGVSMSQPRRRRRRKRRSGQPSDPNRSQASQGASQQQKQEQAGSRNRRRRRGRRGRPQDRQSASPTLSEDLVRALPTERPESLSLDPDGQDLDEIIGELQSVWGVPQYPQEYRITVRVAEERDGRSESTVVVEDTKSPNDGRAPGETSMPIREKAPAAPLMRNRSQGDAGEREKAPRRRRRRRGRGRGGPGSGGSGDAGGTGGSGGSGP